MITPLDTSIATIICAAISATAAIVAAIISSHNRRMQEQDKAEREQRQVETDKRAEEQAEMMECVINYAASTGAATKVLLLNARGDKINGNVEDALEKLDAAGCRYSAERDKLTSAAITGR